MTTPTDEYNANIPMSTDDLATSQGQFLTNFQQLYNAFLVNHIALDATSNAGNHSIIQLLNSPDPFQTDAGEISIYAKPIMGQTTQLFMRYQGNGQEVPVTNYQIYSIPSTNLWFQFFTFLPGQVMIYFGIVNISEYPYVLGLNPPIAKNIISVNFCPEITPGRPPNSDPIVSTDGIIRSLSLKASFPATGKGQIIYYFVAANI